jgi:hypothetical protein
MCPGPGGRGLLPGCSPGRFDASPASKRAPATDRRASGAGGKQEFCPSPQVAVLTGQNDRQTAVGGRPGARAASVSLAAWARTTAVHQLPSRRLPRPRQLLLLRLPSSCLVLALHVHGVGTTLYSAACCSCRAHDQHKQRHSPCRRGPTCTRGARGTGTHVPPSKHAVSTAAAAALCWQPERAQPGFGSGCRSELPPTFQLLRGLARRVLGGAGRVAAGRGSATRRRCLGQWACSMCGVRSAGGAHARQRLR